MTPPVWGWARRPGCSGALLNLATSSSAAAPWGWRARRHACVEVHGRSRLAAHIAAVLAAAGVGRVHCAGDGLVKLFQVVPGGLTCADEGLVIAAAGETAMRRAAPEVDTTPLPI